MSAPSALPGNRQDRISTAVAAGTTTGLLRFAWINCHIRGNHHAAAAAATSRKNPAVPPWIASKPAPIRASPHMLHQRSFASNPLTKIPSPASRPTHTPQLVAARHGGRLPTSTTTVSPCATTGAAYSNILRLPRIAFSVCPANAKATTITSIPHSKAATRRGVPPSRRPSPTVSKPNRPNHTPAARCLASQA